MHEFLTSNEARYRLGRTIVQGCIGVIIANLDLLIGMAPIQPAFKPLIVALVMAILSPIMAELGARQTDADELDTRGMGEDDDFLYQEITMELDDIEESDEPVCDEDGEADVEQ